ncbi:orexin receptor type 2-like [Harmonia axyridis]|uniref:orexin receptor type 2-like n=1 Tax=Harmonia axyridis TaxID=115357 RepID=UPI001E277B5C|nr:orexin receptor type 2-like [Harmonia axyridis]
MADMGLLPIQMETASDDFEDLPDFKNFSFDPEDQSGTPFINEIWTVKPLKRILLDIAVILPVVLIGLAGNFLLIFTLITNKHLQTPTNLMIGNMALADMLSLLIHPWVYIITYDIFQNYVLGEFVCKTEAALESAILISSVISLSVISYDRLTSIAVNSTALDIRRTKICMVLTWVTGFILSSPQVFLRKYKERQWKDFLETMCGENPIIIKIYWPTIITVLVWIPLSIMIVCYISIFAKLRRFEKVVLRKALNHQKKASYKKKAARMMFIVILTFTICRLPFTALIFWRYSRFMGKSAQNINDMHGGSLLFWFTSKYLIFVNAAVNPIIYGITNEKLRRAFRKSKLSKWLFCDKKVVTDLPKNEQITTERIFFIFKKKLWSKGDNATDMKKPKNEENILK